MAPFEQTSSFTGFCKQSTFEPAILNPLHLSFHQPKSRCHHSRNTASLSKQGHFYNYVHFSITLYPLMEAVILETSHLIMLLVKTHKMRNYFTLHFVFTFVTPKFPTVVMINTQDFRGVMPCQLLHTYRSFCGAYSLQLLVWFATQDGGTKLLNVGDYL